MNSTTIFRMFIIVGILLLNFVSANDINNSNRKEPKPRTYPVYNGGYEAMMSYLDRIVYPKKEAEEGVEGTVYISFKVKRSGKVTDVKVARGVPEHPAFEQEAVRVISMMPNWIPGTVNGKPTAMIMTLPIKFALEKNQ